MQLTISRDIQARRRVEAGEKGILMIGIEGGGRRGVVCCKSMAVAEMILTGICSSIRVLPTSQLWNCIGRRVVVHVLVGEDGIIHLIRLLLGCATTFLVGACIFAGKRVVSAMGTRLFAITFCAKLVALVACTTYATANARGFPRFVAINLGVSSLTTGLQILGLEGLVVLLNGGGKLLRDRGDQLRALSVVVKLGVWVAGLRGDSREHVGVESRMRVVESPMAVHDMSEGICNETCNGSEVAESMLVEDVELTFRDRTHRLEGAVDARQQASHE